MSKKTVTSRNTKSRNLVSDEKRSRHRRNSGNKGGFKKTPSRLTIYGDAYSQLKRDVGWLLSHVNVEDKYRDVSNSVTLSGAWQFALINGIAQGNTSSQRSGQSVKALGIEFRYTLYNNVSNSGSTTRIILVRDKQANAAAPTFVNVFPVDVTTPRVVGFLERFELDVEDVISLDNVGISSYSQSHVFTSNWHVQFNSSNNGDITDIVTNSYYVAYVSDAIANFPVLTYTTRFVYVDN